MSGYVRTGVNRVVAGSDEILKMELANQRLIIIGGIIAFVIVVIVSIWQPKVLWIDAFGGVGVAIKWLSNKF